MEFNGYAPIIIAKKKELNMFVPEDESYITLKVSEFLSQQSFTKVISFRRFFGYDYILTD